VTEASAARPLVTNHEALKFGVQCCQAVFPETHPGEWAVTAVDAPGTGGHCLIDFTHNSSALDFNFSPEQPDIFGPLIRVTNSYNGLRALAFDVGFFRKICSNGMIAPESIIRFKYTHQRHEIGDSIRFESEEKEPKSIFSKFEKKEGKNWTCSASLVFENDKLVRVTFAHKDVRSPYQWQSEKDPKKAEKMRKEEVPTCAFSLPRCAPAQ
jgi:hypothetical protein